MTERTFRRAAHAQCAYAAAIADDAAAAIASAADATAACDTAAVAAVSAARAVVFTAAASLRSMRVRRARRRTQAEQRVVTFILRAAALRTHRPIAHGAATARARWRR